MKESPFIEQMIVVGPERKFTAALIVPAFANLRSWCQHHEIVVTSDVEMLAHPKVLEHYQHIVDRYNEVFNPVEKVKKFSLLNTEWTINGGELTPTLKLKRKVIMEKYASEVEALYAEDQK
jgi:long-chain acyl-CoA synthetase